MRYEYLMSVRVNQSVRDLPSLALTHDISYVRIFFFIIAFLLLHGSDPEMKKLQSLEETKKKLININIHINIK
jgi:hypothetical protein